MLLLIKIFGNGIPCIILCVSSYLKLILRISRFRIIVTSKAEDNNKSGKTSLKKNINQLQNRPCCILYIIVSLLSRHRLFTTVSTPWIDLSTWGRISFPIWNLWYNYNNIQLFPEGKVNSGGWIHTTTRSVEKSSAVHRAWGG